MHEIIHIVDPQSLTGQIRHGLEIEAVTDRPLDAGYYFVIWPAARQAGRNHGKRYFGPFQTCAEARLLQRSALSLGLIQDGMMLSPEVVECRSIVRPLAATLYPATYRDHRAAPQSMAACAG
ncbi:MAG: hypothetical protein Q8M20_04080 [Rhodocyclaceae bacterium]|nr:hypothetical protein [Rhodocyclaceae bacterium]MDZ4213937.1 hypothetical protein [Rhodocyclaceae bacterium]